MIFKNEQESAKLLVAKIKEEFPDISYLLTYIDQDSSVFANTIGKASYLPDTLSQIPATVSHLIITDRGNTRASEYVEFVDQLRKQHPQLFLIIAIPVIPQSEEKILQENCNSLLTLFIEPYFFSIDQFYQH